MSPWTPLGWEDGGESADDYHDAAAAQDAEAADAAGRAARRAYFTLTPDQWDELDERTKGDWRRVASAAVDAWEAGHG